MDKKMLDFKNPPRLHFQHLDCPRPNQSLDEMMAKVTPADVAAVEAMTVPEFDESAIALADSILNDTWRGTWHGDESPLEWAKAFKVRLACKRTGEQ